MTNICEECGKNGYQRVIGGDPRLCPDCPKPVYKVCKHCGHTVTTCEVVF